MSATLCSYNIVCTRLCKEIDRMPKWMQTIHDLGIIGPLGSPPRVHVFSNKTQQLEHRLQILVCGFGFSVPEIAVSFYIHCRMLAKLKRMEQIDFL